MTDLRVDWATMPPIAYWLLPAAVGGPLILRALLRYAVTRPRSGGRE